MVAKGKIRGTEWGFAMRGFRGGLDDLFQTLDEKKIWFSCETFETVSSSTSTSREAQAHRGLRATFDIKGMSSGST